MAVTPTGAESLPIDSMRTAVATSTTFQTWIGATGDAAAKLAAAKARIYPIGAETYTLPCAIVDTKDFSYESVALGIKQFSGTVTVRFLMTVSASHTDQGDAAYAFLNQTGAIMAEVMAQTTGLCMRGIRRNGMPERTNEDDAKTMGDTYFIEYDVDVWGA